MTSASKVGGPWTLGEVESFLDRYVAPVRLAVVSPSGFPLVCSLWYLYEGGRILCATQGGARVVEALRGDPRCGFEIAPNEPPYFGVRGQGEVALSGEGALALLGRLVDRYLGTRESRFARWLLESRRDEVVLAIDPGWITSWDYRQRMDA